MGTEYKSYEQTLELLEYETLHERRIKLCEKFAKKALKHPKYKNWFNLNEQKPSRNTRYKKTDKFLPVKTRTDRYRKSPLPYLTEILNGLYN